MKNLSFTTLLLGAIVLIGAFLRFAALRYGIPLDLFGDEFLHVATAFNFFDEMTIRATESISYAPSLLAIALAPFFALFGGIGMLLGMFEGVIGFKAFVLMESGEFLTAVRLLSALTGIAFLGLIYFYSNRVYGYGVAVIALLLASYDFWLVHESQMGHLWMPVVFLIMASWYALLRLSETGSMRWYALSVVAIALGYWAGFIPILLMPFLVLAHFMSPAARWNRLAVSMASLVALIAAISWLNPFSFLRQFGGALWAISDAFGVSGFSEFQRITDTPMDVWGNAATLLGVLLAANPLLLIAGVIGVVLLTYREGLRKFSTWLVLGFPILYFTAAILIWTNPDDRYVLPLLPSLLVGAGYLFSVALSRFKTGSVGQIIVAILIFSTFLYSAYTTINYSKLLFTEDTRESARNWIHSEVPAGTALVVDSTHYLEFSRNREVAEVLEASIPQALRSKDRFLLYEGYGAYPSPSYFVLTRGEFSALEASGATLPEIQYYVRSFYRPESAGAVPSGFSPVIAFSPRETVVATEELLQDSERAVWLDLLGLKNLGPYVEIYRRESSVPPQE